MNIGEKIIKLRKENHMSQEDLAFKLNISRQSISKWESNTSTPDAYNILELSKLFNVTTDYLLYDDYKSDDDIPQIKEVKKNLKLNKEKELKNIAITITLWIIAAICFIITTYLNIISSPLLYLNIILCIVLAVINGYRYINIKNNTNNKYTTLKMSLMLIVSIITLIITYAMNRFTYNEILFFTLCMLVITLVISNAIENIFITH